MYNIYLTVLRQVIERILNGMESHQQIICKKGVCTSLKTAYIKETTSWSCTFAYIIVSMVVTFKPEKKIVKQFKLLK